MGVLEEFLKYCLSQAKRANPQTFIHQAFGAVQYYLFVWPDEEDEVSALWDVYKPQFEELIYGVTP